MVPHTAVSHTVSHTKSGRPVKKLKPGSGILTNSDGLEYVKMVHPDSGASAEVFLFGGVVTSFKDGQGTEYIAIRKDAKLDGSKPISGGLTHCFPQFGAGKIQQHGFARDVMWTLKSATDIRVELELAPSEYTKAIWDKPFLITYVVSLEANELKTDLFVVNVGLDPFDFQAALHSYFSISDLRNVEIAGSFKGQIYLDRVLAADSEKVEERDTIKVTRECDTVYKGVTDPVLKDSGAGKALKLSNEAGWADTIIWNPYGNEAMGYNKFICVESGKFDPVTLEPGKSWRGLLVLKPTEL